MKGYRTLLLNASALIFTLLTMYGLEVPVEDQGTITAALLAVLNIFLRFKTDTPVGKEKGFVSLHFMSHMAVISLLVVFWLPGCSSIKSTIDSEPFQPLKDCVSTQEPARTTIAACYTSITMLANSIDAAEDYGLITKDQERYLIEGLREGLYYLQVIRKTEDLEKGAELLIMVQSILTEINNQIPEK